MIDFINDTFIHIFSAFPAVDFKRFLLSLVNKQKKTDFLIARNYFNYLWKSHFEWRPQQTTKQSARQFYKKNDNQINVNLCQF